MIGCRTSSKTQLLVSHLNLYMEELLSGDRNHLKAGTLYGRHGRRAEDEAWLGLSKVDRWFLVCREHMGSSSL